MTDMELPEIVAVCPSCGSEFQPHVTHCIDCGAATHSAWAAPELPQAGQEEPDVLLPPLPPETPVSFVRRGDAQWVKMLERVLARNGIPCRLDVYDPAEPPPSTYTVRVAEADLERAMELDHELLLTEVPDFAETFRELPAADRCPACGSPVSLDDTECPSCGLALNGPES